MREMDSTGSELSPAHMAKSRWWRQDRTLLRQDLAGDCVPSKHSPYHRDPR